MRVAATYTTKTYVRPYPLQEKIAEILHHIKATASKANLVNVTFDSIIVVALVFLISYAAVRFNEQRIAASYIDQAYKAVLNPYR
jgi:hypothetical protein